MMQGLRATPTRTQARQPCGRWRRAGPTAARPKVPACRTVAVRAAAPPTDTKHQQQPRVATGSKQQEQQLPAMPRLPPRSKPATRSPSSSPSSPSSPAPSHSRSKRRPPAPQPPGGGDEPQPERQSPQERALGGVLAYAGLLGSVATAVSYVSPDVDLFGGFNALQPADIALGLQLVLPCCLLNAAIMWPDYSSWRVPAEPTLQAQTQMAESLLSWTAKQKDAKAAAAAAGGSLEAQGAGQGGAAAASSGSSSSRSEGAVTATAAASAASSLSAGPPPMFLPPFGSSPSEQQLPPPLARAKDALLMAQGHYLSAAPSVPLPGAVQAGLLVINCLAAELLYRSVTLQVAGGWLTDRISEAGAEDAFAAVLSTLPVLPTPHMAGQLAAVALLSSAWLVAVGRRVARMTRRPAFVMESQGRVASSQLLQDLRHAAAKRQQQQSPTAERQPQVTAEQDSSSSDPTAAPPATSSKDADSAEQQQQPGSWQRQLPNTLNALALSQLITGARDLSQAVGLGLAFALTGNLAAPFVAAVVSEGMLVALQRRGQERVRQRSIAFAKHMASFSRVFRNVQRKQQQKEGVAVQPPSSDGMASPAEPGVASPLAAAAASDAAGSASDGGSAALQQLVAGAAVVGGGTTAGAVHDAAAAASSMLATPEAAGGGAGGGVDPAAAAASSPATRMEATIGVLDQLLGEQQQLGEQS